MKIEGVKFELYSDELNRVIASGKTNAEGKLKFTNLRTGTYKLYEVEANEWYRLDNTKHSITIKKDETTYKTIKNQPKMGHIAIIKYDRDYKEMKLEKAKFAVLDSKGVTVDTIITDKNGYGKSKELPIYETYTVKEIETPTHYLINANETTVKYNSNEDNATKEYEYYDIRKEGNLKVYKVDENNQRIALGNVEFDLYSKEFNKVIGTFYTDVNGEILVKNLREADYMWIEKTTNQWYNLAENTDVSVEWNKTIETTILNKLKQGKVQVVKVDKDNNEIKLKGVKFQVIDDKGNVLETIITNEKGEATTKEYPIRDFENLTLKEVETLKEYKLNDNPIKVTLKANEVITKHIENEVKKAQIKVIKVDKDNNEIKLEGVIFDVLDQDGNIVQTLKTDKNGEATTKKLPISKTYSVRERETLREYKLNTEEITSIKLKEDEIRTITFENELKKAKVQVIKVDKENHEIKLKDVEFEVYNSKGELVDTIKTNEKGIATTKELPVNESYSLKEIETQDIYELNEEIKVVELQEDQITNITFENKLKKAKIQVIKVDKENHEIKLKDVEFEVYNSKGELVDTIKTDEKGIAITKELAVNDRYSLKETKTSEFYKLNEEITEIDLTKYIAEYKENIVENITIENQVKKGKVRIIKTDGETTYPLKDVVFEIYNSKDELVDTIITDENGEATTKELRMDDQYTVVEKITNKGYVLNDKPQTIELKEDEITNMTFENFKEKGKIKIIKSSSDGKVEGFTFKITGISITGENFEKTVTTDKDGIILIDDVLVGEYTIEEIRDEAYEETEPQTVKVVNGETAEVSFYNKLIEVETPKTGDDSNIKFVAGILLLAILGLACICSKIYKEKKNKKKNNRK